MNRASHQMRPNRLDDFAYANQLLKYKSVSSGCKEVKIYICPPYHRRPVMARRWLTAIYAYFLNNRKMFACIHTCVVISIF